MSYLSQFLKVKPVLTDITVGDLNRVLVHGGRIYATDEFLIVSAPFRSDLEFFVDGFGFGDSVKSNDVVLTVEGNHLEVMEKRGTTSIPLADPKKFSRPVGEWKPLPASMMPAFRALARFRDKDHTRPWACSITIRNGKTYVTNNRIFALWEGGGDNIDATFLGRLIDYLICFKEDPVDYIIEDNWISFRYEDDTEVCSERIEPEMPKEVVAFGDSITRRGLPIPQGWFEAVKHVSRFPGCSALTIAPNSISTKTDTGAIFSRKINSPCNKETVWDPKLMNQIAHIATHIDLDAWPDPAAWYGRNVRGLIESKCSVDESEISEEIASAA